MQDTNGVTEKIDESLPEYSSTLSHIFTLLNYVDLANNEDLMSKLIQGAKFSEDFLQILFLLGDPLTKTNAPALIENIQHSKKLYFAFLTLKRLNKFTQENIDKLIKQVHCLNCFDIREHDVLICKLKIAFLNPEQADNILWAFSVLSKSGEAFLLNNCDALIKYPHCALVIAQKFGATDKELQEYLSDFVAERQSLEQASDEETPAPEESTLGFLSRTAWNVVTYPVSYFWSSARSYSTNQSAQNTNVELGFRKQNNRR